MTLFEKFLASSLETAGIGLETDPLEHSNLVPSGAELIGWTGEAQIRFCFLPGLSDAVFAVDPTLICFPWVYPVARSFADFMGLISACHGAEPLTKAWRQSRQWFYQSISQTPLNPKQRSILRAIHNIYNPPEIADPYGYLLEMRGELHTGELEFPPQLAEEGIVYPEDKPFTVSFSSDFNGKYGKDKPGKAIALNHAFTWGSQAWQIPAAYQCKEGLVLDMIAEVPAEQICAYQERAAQADDDTLPDILQEDPLNLQVDTVLTLNGRSLSCKRGSYAAWNPRDDNSPLALRLIEHYQLDRESGWVFLRKSYRWHGKRPPVIQALKLTMQAPPVTVTACRFEAAASGQTVDFINPLTGGAHTLTVLECTQEVLEFDLLTEYPCQYRQLRYSLAPDLPESEFTLRDCKKNAPLRSSAGAGAIGIIGDASHPANVGIIGGADGPTMLFFTPPADPGENIHTACSALQYSQPGHVVWRLDFQKKPIADITVDILR